MSARLTNQIRRWCFDPVSFVQDVIAPKLITTQQRQGLDEYGKLIQAKCKAYDKLPMTATEKAYAAKRGISVMSGQGTGKDAFASWCILHFLTTTPFPKILCTAPAGPQLRAVLWTEIHKWWRQSELLRDIIVHQAEKVYFKEHAGKEWFAIPRTIAPTASPEEQAETLAGLHEDFMLYVIDEASGVPDPVFRPIEGSMTGKCNFALVIFNPTKNYGYALETQTKMREHYICLHWDAEKSEIVGPEHIKFMERKFGRDSNAFRIRVNGLPPTATPDTLIPWDWCMAAVDRDLVADASSPIVLGVDVARYGDDKSIILRRQGPIVCEPITEFSGLDTEQLAYQVLAEIHEHDPSATCIDVIGVGAGVYDKVKNYGSKVLPVNVSEKPSRNPEKFTRLRDELWWQIRERFETGTIKIPNDSELIGELTTIKYNFSKTIGDKIKIESKHELRQRGLSSPNKADALILTEFGQFYTAPLHRRENHQVFRRRVMPWTVA